MYQANCHSPAQFKGTSAVTNPEESRNLCLPPLCRITFNEEVIEALTTPALSSEHPEMHHKRGGVIILALRVEAQTGICLKFPQGLDGTWE